MTDPVLWCLGLFFYHPHQKTGCSGLEVRRPALSGKLQASSLTAGPGDDRIDLERNNYE